MTTPTERLVAAVRAYFKQEEYLRSTELHDNYTDRARAMDLRHKALCDAEQALAALDAQPQGERVRLAVVQRPGRSAWGVPPGMVGDRDKGYVACFVEFHLPPEREPPTVEGSVSR